MYQQHRITGNLKDGLRRGGDHPVVSAAIDERWKD